MEKLTWDQMVEKYPNKWLALTNCEMRGCTVLAAEVVKVLDDEEVDDYRVEKWDEDYRYERTTDKTGVGIIDVKEFRVTVG